MKIYIKNIVCHGTRLLIIQELKRLGFNFRSFESGEIDLEKDLSLSEIKIIHDTLHEFGLDVIFMRN